MKHILIALVACLGAVAATPRLRTEAPKPLRPVKPEIVIGHEQVRAVVDSVRGNTLIVDWHGTWDYSTIQDALDASTNGDTIIVLPSQGSPAGAYVENVVIPPRAITLRSINPEDPAIVAGTVIDGGGADSVVKLLEGGSNGVAIEGFTIRNGDADFGGGIHCEASTLTVSHCVVRENSAEYGGGIYGSDNTLSLTACTISDNEALRAGGGVRVEDSSLTIAGCRVSANTAGRGGGVSCAGGSGSIRGCVISENKGWGGGGGVMGVTCSLTMECSAVCGNQTSTPDTHLVCGGGVYCLGGSCKLRNCVLSGNVAGGCDQLSVGWYFADPLLDVSFSDIHGDADSMCLGLPDMLIWGPGNIDADPMFVDPDGPDNDPQTWEDNDYHLLPGSPCVNTGDPGFAPGPDEVDIDGDPRVQGCRVDMGADETGAAQAAGDFDGDGDVDLADFGYFQLCFDAVIHDATWSAACVCTFDFDASGCVDLADLDGLSVALTGP